MKNLRKRIAPLLLLIVSAACGDKSGSDTLFELMPATYTGVDFQNRLTETPQMNIFTYLYFYNGGGVAAGDLNGDDLPDLYFTSNLEENKLYLNKGDFKFEDITEQAQVAGKRGWTTGVTMADVNGDGLLDIYVSQLGDYQNIRGKNQLYINLGNDEKGVPVFEDQATVYGLDLVGFSTQAAFFDYDLDGDLDMYMLNHSVHSNGTFGRSKLRQEHHPLAGDKLLRNDDGKFTDVTEGSGVYSSVLGYGLGITVGDVNWDGYPDIYIGNDFHENDYLYINNGPVQEGKPIFTEQLEQSIKHTSRFSMGNDIGDINNDALPDIFSLDMLPEDLVMLKTSGGEDSYDVYNYKLKYGYSHQFARNSLQLNMGQGHFSDIGLITGTFATDWSWSGLIADLDLDGNKDIYIANGIKRRSNDLDYIKYVSNDAIQHRLEGDLTDEDMALIETLPIVKIPNYAFKNQGKLHFENMSQQWGLNQESFSNGAAYVDLDNDGDLDLVTNNIDQDAFIYKNKTIDGDSARSHYLKIKFEGKAPNTKGVGARMILPLDSQTLIQEVYPTRGYQSSVPCELVIGLGEKTTVDSLIVVWPNHQFEVLHHLQANNTIIVNQENATGKYQFPKPDKPLFENITQTLSIPYQHQENTFVEFNREVLIPHMSSTEGPSIAVGDVNGDDLEDFYIGGAKRQSGELYLQTASGFEQSRQAAFHADSTAEDVASRWVDVDQDGDLDLIVASGGNEFQTGEDPLLVRLYKNDGKGNFSRDTTSLPKIYMNASCIAAADFDQDGDMDLFIGGRVVTKSYGKIPQSYLLQNNGQGQFKDITRQNASKLQQVGMVKDARWADMDQDGLQDLVVVGEWMPVTIFYNKQGKLTSPENESLAYSNGWWNTVEVVDIDQDGDLDLLAGNLGLNSKLHSSKKEPVSLVVKDIDGNGKIDPIMFHYINGKKFPFATKDELGAQLTDIKNRFVRYRDFAMADVDDIFSEEQLEGADRLYAYEFRSGTFINDGKGNFTFKPLPRQAQFSPVNAFYLLDVDQDQQQDVLAAGNFYEVNIERGRYDASYGTLLKNNGKGKFTTIANNRTGLYLEGQVRALDSIRYQGEKIMVVVKNNDKLQFIRQSPTQKPAIRDLGMPAMGGSH